MLKRHQVLLEDWIVEHLRDIAGKYDISFSEVVRLLLCVQIPRYTKIAYPKFNVNVSDQELHQAIKNTNQGELDIESLHKIISKVYFEARGRLSCLERLLRGSGKC